MAKSIRVERVETRHLNLKSQDKIRIYDDKMHDNSATIAFTMIDADGKTINGNFYLNDIDVDLLETLYKKIGPYLEKAKTARAEWQTACEEAERRYRETGVPTPLEEMFKPPF